MRLYGDDTGHILGGYLDGGTVALVPTHAVEMHPAIGNIKVNID